MDSIASSSHSNDVNTFPSLNTSGRIISHKRGNIAANGDGARQTTKDAGSANRDDKRAGYGAGYAAGSRWSTASSGGPWHGTNGLARIKIHQPSSATEDQGDVVPKIPLVRFSALRPPRPIRGPRFGVRTPKPPPEKQRILPPSAIFGESRGYIPPARNRGHLHKEAWDDRSRRVMRLRPCEDVLLDPPDKLFPTGVSLFMILFGLCNYYFLIVCCSREGKKHI